MPALQHAYEQYAEEGLVVLGVNQLFADNLKAAQDFVTELALTFPNVIDETGNVSQQGYNVIGLPTSAFINAAGEIVHVQVGQLKEEQIDLYIQQLIGKEAVIPSNE
jgi:peroxiredoxin